MDDTENLCGICGTHMNRGRLLANVVEQIVQSISAAFTLDGITVLQDLDDVKLPAENDIRNNVPRVKLCEVPYLNRMILACVKLVACPNRFAFIGSTFAMKLSSTSKRQP